MKLFVPAIIALAAADDKKVPPRHPLQRLTKLNKFANEWIDDNLDVKQAANWGPKFDRNTARMERRFEQCGYYDDSSEHGGPRERRETNEETLERYDKNNPIRGIQQITRGFSKWAERYVVDCKLQPAKLAGRMTKWFGQLTAKLAANQSNGDDSDDEGY